jgi:hypothetical protein
MWWNLKESIYKTKTWYASNQISETNMICVAILKHQIHDKNEDTFIVVLILVWFQLGPYNQQIWSVIISAWWKVITSYNLDIFEQEQPPAQLYSMPNNFVL